MFRVWPTFVSCVVLCSLPHDLKALDIEFLFDPGVSQQARDAYGSAAAEWESRLADDITVRIQVGLDSVPALEHGTPLSQATTVPEFGVFYADFQQAMQDDTVQSLYDHRAISSWNEGEEVTPIGMTFEFGVPITARPMFRNDERTGVVYLDNDTGLTSYNNTQLAMPPSNMKALGLTIDIWNSSLAYNDTTIDGTVVLNQDVNWDYDPADGIDSDKVDFVGAAAHELARVLGFHSGVDFVDYVSAPNGPARPENRAEENRDLIALDRFAYYTSFDLYRYTRFSSDEEGQGGPGVQDGGSGTRGPDDVPYFSLDGGSTKIVSLSSGIAHGNEQSAGHWDSASGSPAGLMDGRGSTFANPSASAAHVHLSEPWVGLKRSISAFDLIALDAIGYDLVSVPGDFDASGELEDGDIGAFCDALGTTDSRFDLLGDSTVNIEDLEVFLRLAGIHFGDADFNGAVEFDDFVALAENFGGHGAWSDGDFNCSGTIDFSDFVLLAENFGEGTSPATAQASVPEPQTGLLLVNALLLFGYMTRTQLRWWYNVHPSSPSNRGHVVPSDL